MIFIKWESGKAKSKSYGEGSYLGKNMWGEAVQTVAYLVNRSSPKDMEVTTAEKWFEKMPNLTRLQVFGTKAYAKMQGYTLDNR